MTNLAILGPGLLGGSIALAARVRGLHRVALWARRPEAIAEITAQRIAERASSNVAEIVCDADLVVLCVPIGAMPALAREVAAAVPPQAIVTDVGSVKGGICAELREIFRARGRFVGSHPMAGSHQTGLSSARADLFEDAVSIVTPDADSDSEAVSAVCGFWAALGCRVRKLSPTAHDEIAALISHVPHMVAAALVNTVAAENAEAFDFCGPGFRDTTRVAGGPPEMWAEILGSNQESIRKVAAAVIEKLHEMVTLLDRNRPMTQFLTQAKAQRDRLRVPPPPNV